MNEHDATNGQDEAAALRRLPRERRPPGHLRERVREELLRAGTLRRDSEAARRRSQRDPRLWLRLAAAVVVAFGFGVMLGGEWTRDDTSSPLPPIAVAVDVSVPTDPGVRVQRLGSEYVSAVAALGESGPEATPELLEAKEAAFAALRGAAGHLADLPGQDPAVGDLLRALRASGEPHSQEGRL